MHMMTFCPGFFFQMVVLSGNKTTQEGQNVEGKMIFRKSNNKVYVQQELKLNVLAREKVYAYT